MRGEHVIDEEVLEAGRPPVPRRFWVGGLVLLAVAVGGFAAGRAWPHPSHETAPPPSSGSVYQPPPPIPLGTFAATAPWPTAPSACGGSTDLPIVSSVPVRERTGITALLGGRDLRIVDFDTGRSVAVRGGQLLPNEFVTGFTGTPPYITTVRCTDSGLPARVMRVSVTRAAAVVAQLHGTGLLADGTRAWQARWPSGGPNSRGSLVPLEGGIPVRLPPGFDPEAITGGVVVGESRSARTATSVRLVDAATGQVRANFGPGVTLAAGHGQVLWSNCDVSAASTPCTLHLRAIDAGQPRDYPLPRPPAPMSAVLSPDGRQLAFTLERANRDTRYDAAHPFPPTNIAVLNLDDATVAIVPGIELPAKYAPGLSFSADGRWLVIALDAGTKTRLLAWRPGLEQPYETAPILGSLWTGPSVAVLG
ncbi:MAG TPA: hypothetical protein VE442_06635 [Jatrophihabitans sp.]|nr:hypothetical protein [Jatrophihabitans sp.]